MAEFILLKLNLKMEDSIEPDLICEFVMFFQKTN